MLRVAFAALLAAFVLWLPAFRSPFATGFGDWQFFHHMWEAGYVALTRYGEWPLWDPYHCGGITIFGNPQSQHLSPFYLLALLAGPTLGSKLFVVLHSAAGFAGMYLFARTQGLRLPGGLLAALAWGASGFFASHGSGGHSAFMPFYLAPWVLLAWHAAARDVRHVLSVVALLVLVLLEGGVYPFPYLVLLLAFDTAVRLALRERIRGILVAGVASAVLVGLVGAIRVLPIADELRRNPRTMKSTDGVSFAEVLEMLTAREHGWYYAGHPFVWPEYVTYVGWGILALGVVGVVIALSSGHKRIVLGLLVFLGLMMGDHGELSPWSLVHRLPIYDSLRVPSRFAVFFTLYLGLLAGLAIDALDARFRASSFARQRPRARWAAYLACAAIAVDLLVVHFPTINRWKEPPIITDEVADHYHLSTKRYDLYYASFPRMNLGTRGCYEAMTFSPARRLWSGDKPQARVRDRGRGEVIGVTRTTRRVFIDVNMREAGRVLVNQNYAPGWNSDVGTVVEDRRMLVLELPEGRHHITLTYTPPTLAPSLAISAFGLLLALAWLRWGVTWSAWLGVPSQRARARGAASSPVLAARTEPDGSAERDVG